MLIELYITQGEDLDDEFQAVTEAGAAVDLTGFSGRGQIRSASGTLLATLTVPITVAATGRYRVQLANTLTAALAAGNIGSFDVELYSGTRVYKSLAGPVHVRGEVTT